MHVVVELVVPLVAELYLLEVDLDADVADVNVLQTQVLLQAIRALVRDVPESVEQLLGPILEEWDLRQQRFAQVCEELLQGLSLFYLEKVLIVVGIRHVIEAEITWTVFRQKKLFCGANLIEKLCQQLVVLEALWDLEALNREALVAAVGQLLDDAALVEFEYAYRLFTVVNGSHTLGVELALKGGLLLLDHFVWQFYLFVVSPIDFIPNEPIDVLACASHFLVDLFHGILAINTLSVARVDQTRKLMQLIALQETDVHQID